MTAGSVLLQLIYRTSSIATTEPIHREVRSRGTGLALAIAKWITEIHRADLSASVGEERNGRPSGSPFDMMAGTLYPSS